VSFFPCQVEIVDGFGAEVGGFHKTLPECGNAFFVELIELLCCHVLLAPPYLILSIQQLCYFTERAGVPDGLGSLVLDGLHFAFAEASRPNDPFHCIARRLGRDLRDSSKKYPSGVGAFSGAWVLSYVSFLTPSEYHDLVLQRLKTDVIFSLDPLYWQLPLPVRTIPREELDAMPMFSKTYWADQRTKHYRARYSCGIACRPIE
jgi:hypothetical protein